MKQMFTISTLDLIRINIFKLTTNKNICASLGLGAALLQKQSDGFFFKLEALDIFYALQRIREGIVNRTARWTLEFERCIDEHRRHCCHVVLQN